MVYRLSDQPHLSRPPKADGPAILYVSHHSADAELRDEPLVRELLKAEPKATFYACDVRGIGESRPDTCGTNQFLSPYGSDYFYAIHSLMLDRPYVGQKTFDLLRVLDWLTDHGHQDVHLAGKGWGSVPATFAAVLSDAVTRVTLKNALTSLRRRGDLGDTTTGRCRRSCRVCWRRSTCPTAIVCWRRRNSGRSSLAGHTRRSGRVFEARRSSPQRGDRQ